MKKFFVVFCLIICMFSFVGCSNTDNRIRELNVDDSDIAILTIFSDNGDEETNFLYKSYGHAFLSLENISSTNIEFANVTVKPNETIAIGLWSIFEHFGVWFNVESNYIKEYNKYGERVSLSIGITSSDIQKILQVIDENDNWTPLYNCSKFALDVWNTVAQETEKLNDTGFISPNKLVKEIKLFKQHEKLKELITSDEICYYKKG